MFFALRYKLLAALLLTSLAVAAGLFYFLDRGFERAFLGYVDKMEEAQLRHLGEFLGPWYGRYGGWGFLKGNYPLWYALNAGVFTRLVAGEENSSPNKLSPDVLFADPQYYGKIGMRAVLCDGWKNPVVGKLQEGCMLRPLEYEGRIIGYLGLNRKKSLSRRGDRLFVRQLRVIFASVAVMMLGGVLLFIFPVVAWLLKPLGAIAARTRTLTAGEYATRLDIKRGDELGELAADFNQLAETLETNRTARKQWVADISHELRTPLSILGGELEAMKDGVRPLSMETVQRLHGRVRQLQRLTDDLYELALSDIGALKLEKKEIDLFALLEESLLSCREYCTARGLILNWRLPEQQCAPLLVDAARMRQVFTNLLKNSVHYTDAPGRLEVLGRLCDSEVEILFQDSPPGVNEGMRSRLFDRLFRVDTVRAEKKGEARNAGLGLSICRSIVCAHGGTIEICDSPLGGLGIRIRLALRE